VRYRLSWPSSQVLSARKYTVSYRIVTSQRLILRHAKWILLNIKEVCQTPKTNTKTRTNYQKYTCSCTWKNSASELTQRNRATGPNYRAIDGIVPSRKPLVNLQPF